jgi:polysaccharide deacetylase family protein (PEP-CTERM system associated)
MKCIFSVDVEDWFHILDLHSTPPISEWGNLPTRVENNFRRLLDIFATKNIKATCFFLGWIAQKFPHLVKEAASAGHEIASHGYNHRLVYEMTVDEFIKDAKKSRKIIEDIIGQKVYGYRAAGFSVTGKTSWFFDALSRAGYRYDSSLFPASRGHGGIKGIGAEPYRIDNASGGIIEFPITVTKLMSLRFCFSGGGYFRLFPYPFIKMMTTRTRCEK